MPLLVLVVPKVCCFTFSSVRLSRSHPQRQWQHEVVAPPHLFPQRKRNNCGRKSLWVFFICPSLVERIRFLSLFLQVQINSLKSSGRRTPMTHLHFRSPHKCIGQGILNSLLRAGTQFTKLQDLFQKWLAQTLPISGIPCARPQIPWPIAGPGPGINYWLFSRHQRIQLWWRSRTPSLESYPTSKERFMVFFQER